jgi:hypothetical protein
VFSLNRVFRQVGESALIYLLGVVSDSLQSTIGPEAISWSYLVVIFPFFSLEENKRIHFQILCFEA